MRFDLSRLGSREFEHLSQALAVAVLGNAVSVFGDGPDGGREATFEGRMHYPDPVPQSGTWNGYGVLQAKYKQNLIGTGPDTAWFAGELRKELRAWENKDSGRRKRGRLPQYLLVSTNVTLSPDPERGGIDSATEIMKAFQAKVGLGGWSIWHHDQISTYLAVHDGVRRTYGGLVTTGDVLASIDNALSRLAKEEVHDEPLAALLTRRAAKEMSSQQWVRLSEAGHPTNAKLKLSDVAVDLPAQPSEGAEQRIPGVVAHVVRAGDSIRRPRPNFPMQPHIALVGGPGQGKTTLGQLICQTYRVAILEQRPQHLLGPEIPEVLNAYRNHLDALKLPLPQVLRWPVRVVLSEFADTLVESPRMTLLGFIAAQSREVSPINRRMMREWLRAWPWVLVLDGLDEVADPDTREKALQALSDFYIDAAEVEADILIVATTRPQGYQDELPPRFYQHLILDRMLPKNALQYAEHLTRVRFSDDPEMHDRVFDRLRLAAADPQTSRLMSTPLQVTIMSILLERRATAPRDRYALFDAYYRTLYEREIGKQTSIARLLEDHRSDIDFIHESVGWLLQGRAQHAGEAEAHLPMVEMNKVAVERLCREEYSTEHANELAARLTRAATDRLVMLVGYPGGTVGFEVRSLQELMAARCLFGGTDKHLIDRLQVLAPSAHWRNTWLFAASRLFSEREALRAEVTTTLTMLDSMSPLATRLLPGARLAVEMIEEDITIRQPRFRRLLLTHALRLLAVSYPGTTMTALARAVHAAVEQDPALTHIVVTTVLPYLGGRRRDQVTALDFLAAWADHPGKAAIPARSRLQPILAGTPPRHLEDALAALRSTSSPRWRQTTGSLERERPANRRFSALVAAGGPLAASPAAKRTRSVLIELSRTKTMIPDLLDEFIQQEIVELIADLDETDWQTAAELEKRLAHWTLRQVIPASQRD